MGNRRVSGLIAAASCVLMASVALADQPVKDSYITTKVKAELTKDSTTKARDIKVTTKDGVVNLSGTVDSTMEKSKAEQDAGGIKGVRSVTNELTVK